MFAAFQAACNVAPASRAEGRPSRRQAVKVMAQEYVGAVTATPNMKFAVVVARFNSLVTKQLLEGAHEVFHRHGVPKDNVDVSQALVAAGPALQQSRMLADTWGATMPAAGPFAGNSEQQGS